MSGGVAARNVMIQANGYDLSSSFSKESSAWQCAMEEISAFGPAVVGKSYCPTLMDANLTLDGFYDATLVSGPLAVINAAFGSLTKAVLAIWHIGDAVGARGLAMAADVKTRKRDTDVASVIKLSAEFTSSFGEEDVISHRALSVAAAGANGTTVDNGAATTGNGAAYLQVTAMTTNLQVTVRHSTDNFVGNDVLLGTFSANPAAGTAQRIDLVGPISRYTRIVWTQTGSCTFGVAVNRRVA